MSARKLGRTLAGLFVALGLLFGGSLASAGGSSATAADAAPVGGTVAQLEVDWH